MDEPTKAVIYQILSKTEEQNATMDHLVFEMMQFLVPQRSLKMNCCLAYTG